ncbi:adenylate/guanylate cyclase domain-containing protein [Mycobacteroides chelonae]|uniref:adenylate/guanylate cyclase domain-containing protein n=1 Tax=Mycobacteroides chelonae TaxID=1774 RepID=UPI003AAE1EC8
MMERLREWFRAMHVLGPRWTVFVASMVGINAATLLLLFYFLRHWMPFKRPADDWVFENGPPLFWLLFGVMIVTSVGWALHMEHRLARWYCRGGPPTALELRTALTAPLQQSLLHLGGWAIGAGVFIAVGAMHDSKWTLATIIGCVQSATASFGLTYLLGERILRPIAAKALSASEFHGRFAPSVFVRVRLSWWIGTLAPAIGIIALCGMALWKPEDLTSTRDLALTVLLIVSTTLVGSYGLALLTAGQLADPVRQLRTAISDVAQGDFEARVNVYDGSELGVLQAGFNRMMQVGEERRQLRELFGKHVGADVASQALQLGTNLGGENRYVAVFFVDMIGSTSMASDRDPEEVLTILNDFFRIVVEVVDSRGGFVNKFVGDEALSVFGAPLHRPDATTACLAAARELRDRLNEDFPHPFEFAIGVSAGLAVAGNVGAPERYEYSVIGDPVNEASRLTELAKHRPSRLLASTNALYFADPDEQKHWDHGDSVLLRGRTRATHLAWPAGT